MSKIYGWVTLQEAEDFLSFEIGCESWLNTLGTLLSGKNNPTVSVLVNNYNGKFNTEIAVGNYLRTDFLYGKVKQIFSNIGLELETAIDLEQQSFGYKLIQSDYEIDSAKTDRKIKSLIMAQRQIISCGLYNITLDTPSEDNLDQAQILWAYGIFTGNSNQAYSDMQTGIKKRQVGDLEIEYAESFMGRINLNGTQRARDLLKPYEKSFSGAVITREQDRGI